MPCTDIVKMGFPFSPFRKILVFGKPDKKIVKMFEKSYSEGMITLSIFILMPQIACFSVIWYYLEKIVDLKLRKLKPSGEVPKL